MSRSKSVKIAFYKIMHHKLKQDCKSIATLKIIQFKHLGRLLLTWNNRKWKVRLNISFRKLHFFMLEKRETEWKDRLNKMRNVVFQHTKESEHQLVNVVRERLDMWERKREEKREEMGNDGSSSYSTR